MQSFNINYKRNRHQREFDNDIESKLLHLSTGFGGGKTHALCKKMLKLSYLNAPHPGGLVAPDFKEFKRDLLPEMQAILDDNKIPYKYHGSDHYFTFPWSKGKLYVVSAEKKIRGPNWAYAGINEVTLIPLERYKEIIGRVRVKGAKYPQICSVGTPEGYASEYYDYFVESPPPNLRIIYGSTDDNAENLHEDYIASLENSYDQKMIDSYRKGLWVNLAGNLFYYSYNPARNDDHNIKREDFTQYLCSMDFNVDPFCATLWGYDGFTLYGVDQVELKGGEGYSTQNMIAALNARGYKPYNTVIFPDPAGNARSTKGQPDNIVLRQAGYEVKVKASAPDFRRRQLNVNNLLDKGRIKINSAACKGLKKDFMAVEQDIITRAKSKENQNLTHFSDGLDYLCDYMFPLSGDAKATYQTKIR